MSGDRNRTPFNDEPCLFLRRFLRPSLQASALTFA
jgi:hypothetical protein